MGGRKNTNEKKIIQITIGLKLIRKRLNIKYIMYENSSRYKIRRYVWNNILRGLTDEIYDKIKMLCEEYKSKYLGRQTK